MKPRDTVVNLSDLARARALSHRLAPQPQASNRAEPLQPSEEGSGYIAFSAQQLLTDQVSTSHIASRVQPAQQASVQESATITAPCIDAVVLDTWESLVAWCVSQSSADGALVVNSQGFVIAAHGFAPTEDYDGLGAELRLVMEQLSHLDAEGERLRTLCFELRDKWSMGLHVKLDDEHDYVLGIVGSNLVSNEVRNAIFLTLQQSIPFLK